MNKKIISLLLSGAVLSSLGFNQETEREIQSRQETRQEMAVVRQSYKLEDLCDTGISERALELRVYIHPSEKLWDYQDYRDELFSYVIKFFEKSKIKCNVSYSNSRLKSLSKPFEIGIEVYPEEILLKRYLELRKSDPQMDASDQKGIAITERRIVLINGWEEFRQDTSRREDREWFKSQFHGRTVKEHILRANAGNICHEILHCFGVFHGSELYYGEKSRSKIPNIMSYDVPWLDKEESVGYSITKTQAELMHSFISGNNTFRAFTNARDYASFVIGVEKANPGRKSY